MSDQPDRRDDQGGARKDPDQWVTGDEPMTEAQRAFLQNLSERSDTPFDGSLTKAEASKRIDELRGSAGQLGGGGGNAASGGGDGSGIQRDPDEWVTGDEPMTEAQRAYLERLANQTGEPVDDNLTKAEASKRIDALRGNQGGGDQS